MTLVQVQGRFVPGADQTVGNQCWIDRDLAGRHFETQIGGLLVTVEFPEFHPGTMPQEGYGGWSGGDLTNPERLWPRYFVVATSVEVTSNEAIELDELFGSVADVLRQAAGRVADGIRVQRPQCGFPGETPQLLDWQAADVVTGQPVAVPAPPSPRSRPMIVSSASFSVADAELCIAEGVRLADVLSAHAYYFAIVSPEKKPAIAVLLSAVACETKVKQILLENAADAVSPLLNVVLRRPRILQEPATDLFDHIFKVVFGRSLREYDPDLWKEIVRLFEVRNAVAHRGDEPTIDEARRLVWASRRALHWLSTGSTTAVN
jgi:hypothetical protein